MWFVDMDGILVDFVGGACRTHNRPSPYDSPAAAGVWHIERLWQMPPQEFWAPLGYADWWANLDWTPDGRQILALIEDLSSKAPVYLLTAGAGSPESLAGKRRWIDRHIPEYRDRLITTRHKHLLSQPGRVLVDDHDWNADSWCLAGGVGVLIPRPWNRRHEENQDWQAIEDQLTLTAWRIKEAANGPMVVS